ncbi:MAG: DUF971 domain-containing protein, partial [Nitrospirae bacterium]
MERAHTPQEVIHHQGDGALEIAWADGHRTLYPGFLLRLRCPCPACLTGGPERRRPAPDPEVRVTSMEPVGGYALAVHFSDGHRDGIYRWSYLRHWCPCEACAAAREGEPLPAAEAAAGGCSACVPAAPPPKAAPQPLTL